jgi:nucleotide-binding universal stress UspA family protein
MAVPGKLAPGLPNLDGMNTHIEPIQATTRILVPTDLTRGSDAAVSYAASLGERLRSDVDLLHVWQSPLAEPPDFIRFALYWQSPFCWPIMSPTLKTDIVADFVQTEAGQRMIECLKELDERDVESHGRIALGDPHDPAETIVTVAAEERYGLIVMATHGRDRLFTHSVVERVTRHAPCPVVTVRSASD